MSYTVSKLKKRSIQWYIIRRDCIDFEVISRSWLFNVKANLPSLDTDILMFVFQVKVQPVFAQMLHYTFRNVCFLGGTSLGLHRGSRMFLLFMCDSLLNVLRTFYFLIFFFKFRNNTYTHALLFPARHITESMRRNSRLCVRLHAKNS